MNIIMKNIDVTTFNIETPDSCIKNVDISYLLRLCRGSQVIISMLPVITLLQYDENKYFIWKGHDLFKLYQKLKEEGENICVDVQIIKCESVEEAISLYHINN